MDSTTVSAIYEASPSPWSSDPDLASRFAREQITPVAAEYDRSMVCFNEATLT